MTVTYGTLARVSDRSWRLSWSSDLASPTYYVYSGGVLVATTTATSWVFSVAPGTDLVVEVLDTTADPTAVYDGRATLQWRRSDDAIDYYLIEEYVSGAWVERQRLVEDGDLHYYQWRSRYLEDDTIHQFRVTPVGTNGNSGTALTWSVLMVRVPTPPEVTYSYSNSTNKVTLTEV